MEPSGLSVEPHYSVKMVLDSILLMIKVHVYV